MKRFTIPCDFGSQTAPFHIYVGKGPASQCHPLKYQSHWLRTERGGAIPQQVMESFEKLNLIADDNKVSFEDLCVYALGTAESKSPVGEADPAAPAFEVVSSDNLVS